VTDDALPAPKRDALVRAAAFAAAFAVALTLWLALSWSVALDEWTVGVPVAAFVCVVVARALPTLAVSGRLPRGVVRNVARVPFEVARDSGRVVAALASSFVHGTELEGAFVQADAPSIDAAKRAWLTGLLSIAPNTIVVAVDAKSGRIIAHQLRPNAPTDLQRDVDRALSTPEPR
jgi:multisubunit Na+/H+ antiporter MnhE subunit